MNSLLVDIEFNLVTNSKKKYTVEFKETLYNKFNVIVGDSAIGKTTLVNCVIRKIKTNKVCYTSNSKSVSIRPILTAMLTSDIVTILKSKNTLFLIDEGNYVNIFQSILYDYDEYGKELFDTITKSSSKFLIIARNTSLINVDYKSVYTLQQKGNKVVSKRFYKDYTTFDCKLPIVHEDSNSGADYYKHYYNDVIAAGGKTNIVNVLLKDNANTVVADGSSIGNEIHNISQLCDNVYLPESFEFELANAIAPNDKQVSDYYNNMPDSIDSVERYFENDVMPYLCDKYHLPQYSKKNKLNPAFLKYRIHSVNHYGITETVAELYGINYNSEEECKKLSEELSNIQ